ncbi:hypothetical protein J7399_10450 [Shimia sp. R9_1]|uniref:hypothetical protein n=1 Tax=Shimia sp. R9_1 TaxID=2821111 RepID=UPI001ADB13E1|nr:hypothetical protein [Shimia sp. R9_1]MBO9407850.1 hypothetical protein [Shimia sp. R9_1]
MIPAYALLTHGPKPNGSIQQHPSAKQQLANLQGAANELGAADKLLIFYDHSRSYKSLTDLPTLQELLKRVREQNSAVIIDDFRRLFAHYSGDNTVTLLEELLLFKENIRDLKTGKLLGELPETLLKQLCLAERPVRYVRTPIPRKAIPKAERHLNTRDAVRASRKVRSDTADRKAHELAEVRDRLEQTHGNAPHQAIADAANAEGLRTSRGNLWGPAGVRRLLKRLEEVDGDEETLAARAKASLRKRDEV